MKHPVNITVLLVLLFFLAQVIGVSLVYLDQDTVVQDGEQSVEFGPTAMGEMPEMTPQEATFIVILGVAIGTGLVLLLIKLKAFRFWKWMFLVAVILALTLAFEVLIPFAVAALIAVVLGLWKTFKPNPYVHNFTEVFMYAGIAILFVRLFHDSVLWVTILLILISLYDMFAVWQSKHMVKMAEAQTKEKVFAGLYVPKGKISKEKIPPPPKSKKKDAGVAILGGGDIAFPLIFSSVVLVWLIERNTVPMIAFLETLIITCAATLSLALLFWYSKKGKYYPAMPVLTAGCLLGLGIIWLL